MPIRIANHSITVVRGGERFEVNAGEGFDLTKEEIAQFNELNPNAFRLPAANKVVVVGPSETTNLIEGDDVSATIKNVDADGNQDDSADDSKKEANAAGGKKATTARGAKATKDDDL